MKGRIGPNKKHYKKNPPYASKKRGYVDENLTPTPKAKSRRTCVPTTTTTAVSPMEGTRNSSSDMNEMKSLLCHMSEELGPDFTSSFILSNVAQLLKSAFDNVEEAIATLVTDHLGLVYAPVTAGAVTPCDNTAQQSTNFAMAPAPIAQEGLVPVKYNPRIFNVSPLNPNLPPLQGSHG